jgi:hypothetical protein
VYDLIVIAEVYDSGYGDNKRVVSTRLNDVFELVSEDVDQSDIAENPVNIEIITTEEEENVPDTYIVRGSYGNNNIRLDRNDSNSINIDISPISGWYEEPTE